MYEYKNTSSNVVEVEKKHKFCIFKYWFFFCLSFVYCCYYYVLLLTISEIEMYSKQHFLKTMSSTIIIEQNTLFKEFRGLFCTRFVESSLNYCKTTVNAGNNARWQLHRLYSEKCTLQSANLTSDSYLAGLFWQGHNWNGSFAIKTLQNNPSWATAALMNIQLSGMIIWALRDN